jgi:hypothetical protein
MLSVNFGKIIVGLMAFACLWRATGIPPDSIVIAGALIALALVVQSEPSSK